ncbi:hypothetical protein BH23GEM3_BH23GEM3_03180 [soil metagenome]
MSPDSTLAARLRDRIIADLHLGQLHAGQRLPGVRELSASLKADHRAVTRAFRKLEAEGLVEVRPRSGVYVAEQETIGEEMPLETARWMAAVLVEGWKRGIPVPELPDLVERCTATVRLRCACVESTEDQMLTYRTELENDFGLEVVPVFVAPVPPDDPASSSELAALRERLREMDLVVTTSFHAGLVSAALKGWEIPLVMVQIHPSVVASIRKRLQEGPLTVVALDPSFADRMRAVYLDDETERGTIRPVLAADREAVASLDPSEPVLLTRAARRRLGDVALPMLVPHSPTFGPETAHQLCTIIIRRNMVAEQARNA